MAGRWSCTRARSSRLGRATRILTTKVGSAPTVRLERAYDTFRTACAHLQRFHNAITLAVSQRQASTIDEAQQEAKRAGAVLLQADQMLPPGEVRALPVIAGKTEQSRIEPRFGRIASRLAGKPIDGPLLVDRRLGSTDARGTELHPREARPGHARLCGHRRQPRESRSHRVRRPRRSCATTTPNRWTMPAN